MMDSQTLRNLSNRLQLTVNDKVKVIDFRADKKDPILLAGELISTESLMDPQRFVETGLECATIKSKGSEFLKISFKNT